MSSGIILKKFEKKPRNCWQPKTSWSCAEIQKLDITENKRSLIHVFESKEFPTEWRQPNETRFLVIEAIESSNTAHELLFNNKYLYILLAFYFCRLFQTSLADNIEIFPALSKKPRNKVPTSALEFENRNLPLN